MLPTSPIDRDDTRQTFKAWTFHESSDTGKESIYALDGTPATPPSHDDRDHAHRPTGDYLVPFHNWPSGSVASRGPNGVASAAVLSRHPN